MRSDRLKQVMQEMDPGFDEKNVGMSRFSKFVDEARRRGLLSATKLDNGQYEVALGPAAPGGSRALPPIPGGTEDRQSRARAEQEADAERGEGRRPRRGRGREREPREAGGERASSGAAPLPLNEAFDLLKRVLREMGAIAPRAVGEDPIRERMRELHGNEAEPIFHRPRFGRFLRQAQDAGWIELSKNDRGFEVALKPEAAAEPVAHEAPSRGRGRARSRGGKREEPAATPAAAAAPPEAPAAASQPASAAGLAAAAAAKRAIRMRRGSGGGSALAAQIPLVGVVEIAPEEVAEAAGTASPRGKRPARKSATKTAAAKKRPAAKKPKADSAE
jgi:hypothetical protein